MLEDVVENGGFADLGVIVDVPQPLGEVCSLLAHSARPPAIDEDARPVSGARIVIDAPD